MKKLLLLFIIPVNLFAQVNTPKCSWVSAFTPTEYTPSEIAAIHANVASNYPLATRLSDATTSYNCHNYAWNKSDGGSTYWINTPGDDTYWTDGSYMEVTETIAPYATKVSYASDDHSAVTTTTSNVFISKWGGWPLMQHAPSYCPYSATTLKYYSLTMTGARIFCSGSQNYTALTSTGISSYSWTTGGVITPSSQTGSSNVFTASGTSYNNATWIKVQASPSCAGTTVSATRRVNLGNGPMIASFMYNNGTSFPDPACQYSGGPADVLIHPDYPAGSPLDLNWTNTNCYITINYGTHTNVLWNGPVNSTAMLRVEATGECGVGENATVYVPIVGCDIPPQEWRIFPNPSRTNQVTIVLPFRPGKNAIMEVYDKNLLKRKQLRIVSSTINLSIAEFPSGFIYLNVIDGKQTFRKIVIKE